MNSIQRQEIAAAARAWHDAGICVLPAAPDGQKRPLGKWKDIREGTLLPPSIETVEKTILNGHADGISIICGKVSGNLEMLEADTRDPELVAEAYFHCCEAGIEDVWSRIRAGVEERTPSGGLHWYYKTDGTPHPSLKLAYPEPIGDERADNKATFETRGQGGQSIAAPSAGRTHLSGGSYIFTKHANGPAAIPTITIEQRDILLDCFRKTCRRPAVEMTQPKFERSKNAGDRVGDSFAEHVSWDEILLPKGFKRGTGYTHNGDDAVDYARPGRDKRARSVTAIDDRLIVWTTATALEADHGAEAGDRAGHKRAYDKFAVWAILNYGKTRNPFSAAASHMHTCLSQGIGFADIAAGKQPDFQVSWGRGGKVVVKAN